MAIFVATDLRIEVNAVVLSSFLKKATLDINVNPVVSTAMGALYEAHLAGLRKFGLSCDFNQDHAVASVDATLFALIGSVVTIKLRGTSGAISTSNPEYTGPVILETYNPFDVGVGELSMAPVKFIGAGALARNTV